MELVDFYIGGVFMHFYYFTFDSAEPAVRMNLAGQEYGIEAALGELGFEPALSSLWIGRKHFHFLSEIDLSEHDIKKLNLRLYQNQAVQTLCERFGKTEDSDSPLPFRIQTEFSWNAVIENFDTGDPSATYAEMQLVNFADVEPLFDDFCYYDEIEDGPFKKAFHAFHTCGISSRVFQLAKLEYLATLPCTCGLCAFTDNSWHFYQIGVFYQIDVSDDPNRFNRPVSLGFEQYSPVLNADNIYAFLAYAIVNGSCLLHMSPVPYPAGLLFSPVEITGQATGEERPLSAPAPFNAGTTFDEAFIYNVGQALLVGLFDQGLLRGFFDFGLPDGFNKRHFLAPGCNAAAAAIQWLIANNPTTSSIILSHWHLDHTNMAVQVPACYNLNWYAPSGYSSPSAMKINHFIAANGGTLTLYTAVSAMPNFGINLSIHKITTVGSTHPHHNGIFAELVFANGNKTMLAGDCLLSAVSAAATAAPYHYMQASHHGGVYYRTAAARNPADIPACLPPPAGFALVYYSYSFPNRHHHPSYVADYIGQGWVNRRDTHGAPGLPAPVPPAPPLPAVLVNGVRGYSIT